MTKKTERKAPWKPSAGASGERGSNLTAEEKRAVKNLAERATKKEKKKDEDRILKRLMKKVVKQKKKKKTSSSSSVTSDSSDDDTDDDSDDSDDVQAARRKKSSAKRKKKKHAKMARLASQVEELKSARDTRDREFDILKESVEKSLSTSAESPAGSTTGVTLTLEQFKLMQEEAKTRSVPPSPAKPGIFAKFVATAVPVTAPKTSTSAIITTMAGKLAEANDRHDLSLKGFNKITDEADSLTKQVAAICHTRYFSQPEDLTALQTMVQESGLPTTARNGNTLLAACIRALIVRGMDIQPEELGVTPDEFTRKKEKVRFETEA